ncbi:uncharacterized protein PHALS_14837 [Plasmopara halstedii]|uniref:Uncharacterized protein n=1 Tax=Plasmopara halstedii TaxID=4781 RepID=A0A0P1AY30_PLAHL|nr:uncharacterized protein PHALS_14837 [Plasmopara halstedii]CEG45732.1 hypothetical protein PHALS_14837 [Plasmopara halstedii]|eukprot:XP_024582101.1 hypothetical protein PHALS_14837 [Plasmopara halstedii]
MGLLWLASRLVSDMTLLVFKVALHLSPAAIYLTTMAAIVLVLAMTTQALEHGVLASIHRSKWQKNLQYDDLRSAFYRIYWLVTFLYLICTFLWIYFTERTGFRFIYGCAFCALWWVLQLLMVFYLTPINETNQHQDFVKEVKKKI